MALIVIAAAILLGSVNSENSTISQDVDSLDSCESDFGPWSRALEDWATSPQSDRQGRIMLLPPAKGYYVTERIDTPYLSPPPPPPASPPLLHKQGLPPPPYREWDAPPPPGAGKIVNRPAMNKDKYKPNYPTKPSAVDRVDEPPGKRVSETDLYLLGAIEKLVYRVDRMEKRLRKVEDGVHYALAGGAALAEPCPGNFSRVGAACYWWARGAASALDWKSAALECRARRAALLELPDRAQRSALEARLRVDPDAAGAGFWTGGLNPGLLWIWSHSAKPVESDAGANGTVPGDGRCLALQWAAQRSAYELRGADCSARLRYACELHDAGALANEIQRVARHLRERTAADPY